MILSDLVGQGELIDRIHDLDKSINFLKMLFFLVFVVSAKLLSPDIFIWLIKNGMGFGSKSVFDKENPEKYILSISLLLIFSITSLGVYLTQLGAYNDIGNPVLMNIAITVFFFASFLVVVNFLQASLFKVFNVFNNHFIDVISFLVLVGFGAFTALLAKWFMSDSQYIVTQAIVIVILLLAFGARMVRMLIQGPKVFNQNALLIFFYLCVAEISPFLIIGKLLVNLV